MSVVAGVLSAGAASVAAGALDSSLSLPHPAVIRPSEQITATPNFMCFRGRM
ncbi:MAG: hypothetical protein AB7Q42_24310 [Acidimicrobiia bacterium]